MAPAAPYPRSTLRAILRTHAPTAKQAQLSSSAEDVAFIAYLAHLQRLAKLAKEQALEEAGKSSAGTGKVKLSKAAVRRASRRLLKKGDA
ncbi:hypothetical protein JCM10207_002970 [Rhodosporidiobolus poonsookiae]